MLQRIPGHRHLQNLQSISWLQGTGRNYTLIYILGRPSPLLTTMTLKWYEDRLPAYLRVSKSSLVNPRFVREVVKITAKQHHLLLKDGTTIPIARRRIAQTIASLATSAPLSGDLGDQVALGE